MLRKRNKKHLINGVICLFPPILWIILLLIDGEYIACSKTDWKGEFVHDDKLKIKWCKPTELIPGRNESELQNLTLSYVSLSQIQGFILLLVYSILVIIVVCSACWWFTKEGDELPQEEDRL